MSLFVIFSGRHIEVSELDWNDWGATFPNVDLEQEFRFIDDWLSDHPKRRGTNRFIKNWLKAEQRKSVGKAKEVMVGAGPSDMGFEIKLKRR